MLPMVLALLALAFPEPAISVAELERAAVPDLARRLLPPEVAMRITRGEVRRPWVFSGYRVTFWEAADVIGPTACRRQVHFLDFGGAGLGGAAAPETRLRSQPRLSWTAIAATHPSPADASTCDETGGYVRITPDRIMPMLPVMDRMAAAIGAASSGRRLRFRVSCGHDSGAPCDSGRATLAGLSMRNLTAVAVGPTDAHGNESNFLSFERPPRLGLIWEVVLTHRAGRIRHIGLTGRSHIYH